MPAFLEAEFWSLANPELWVGAGLIIFLAILWMTGAFKMAIGKLDEKGAKIQQDLDEAAKIRAEAEAMLVEINKQRADAENHARAVVESAEEQAKLLVAEAKAKLDESIANRTRLAERKIESAQAEAIAQVRGAAIDLAVRAAESLLVDRLAGAKSDSLVDTAIPQLGSKLQ